MSKPVVLLKHFVPRSLLASSQKMKDLQQQIRLIDKKASLFPAYIIQEMRVKPTNAH